MLTRPASERTSPPAKTANVVVVIPIPNDPDWTIFADLS